MEDCHTSTPCAETAIWLNAVVTSDSLSLPLICEKFDLSFLIFLDSSSTCSFIDEGYVAEHNLPAIPIPPIPLCLINRSMHNSITSALTLSVQFPCGTTHSIRYLVTQLDSEFSAVLRLDWLTQHNPLMDWCHGPCSVMFFPKNNQRMALMESPMMATSPLFSATITTSHLCQTYIGALSEYFLHSDTTNKPTFLSLPLPTSTMLLGDAPCPPMFPPIFLRHLCIFLLIVASPRRSALVAPILESDDHVT